MRFGYDLGNKRARESTQAILPPAAIRTALVAFCLSALPIAEQAAAAGSWVASAPSVRVTMAERESLSAPLLPPASLGEAEAEIQSVVWRFNAPPGASLKGRLCQADACIAVDQMRGRSDALAGRSAKMPLRFHFSLATDRQQAVVVRGLQIIVNYL